MSTTSGIQRWHLDSLARVLLRAILGGEKLQELLETGAARLAATPAALG